MKILHITETATAGVGKHVADLAFGQVQAGHEVQVVYSPLRIDQYFKEKAAESKRIPPLTMMAFPIQKSVHWNDASVLAYIYRICKQNGPFDVIHGHSTKAGLLARLISAVYPALCVYTPHAPQTMNPEQSALRFNAYRWYERLLSSMTNRLIAVSEEEKQHLKELGIREEKIEVVHNGLTPQGIDQGELARRSAFRAKWNIPSDAVCIGFLGRLVPQKNPELMLRAFSCLPRGVRSKAVLALVGSGSLNSPLIKLADQTGITENIRWVQGRDATPGIMCMFDVFALTSRYEGFPYVLLEAMMGGLPSVATHVGGTQALIADQENGFLVRDRTPEAFAARLCLLIEQKRLREQQSLAARKRAAQFSVRAMVEGTLRVYETALDGNTVLVKAANAYVQPE
jgi:glycosyltransferase involved in cell wall biosynthesis